MKKKVFIGILALVLVLVLGTVAAILFTRNRETTVPNGEMVAYEEFEERQGSGEFNGAKYPVNWSDSGDGVAIFIGDGGDNLWYPESYDKNLVEILGYASSDNGGTLFAKALKAGSSDICLAAQSEKLTISVKTTADGAFEIVNVTTEDTEGGVFSLSSQIEQVCGTFGFEAFPEGIEVVGASVDKEADEETEESGRDAYVNFLYKEAAFDYSAKDAGEEKADGKIVTDAGYASVSWKANGAIHMLRTEEKNAELLREVYEMFSEVIKVD